MPSLMDYLIETMPLAGAKQALNAWNSVTTADTNEVVQQKKFEDLTPEELRAVLRYVRRDEDYNAGVPQLRADASSSPQFQPLWGWTHAASDPAKITNVWCRVRGAGFSVYKVLDTLAWGLEDPVGTFRDVVRVTNTSGDAIELPLTPEYVHSKWVAVRGHLPDDATPLWRLEAEHDKSMVVAFVYDIDPVTGKTRSLRDTAKQDPQLAAALDEFEKAAALLSPEAAQAAGEDPAGNAADPQTSHEPPKTTAPEEAPWMTLMKTGLLMSPRGAAGSVDGQVGDTCKTATGPARVLIVLSLTTCKERASFEPGGVVGFARIYPHLMVLANIPLQKIEGSIHYDRPASTSARGPDGRPDTAGSCCKGYDSTDGVIDCILVADVNTDDTKPPVPMPFWSNLFAYYQPQAYDHFANRRFKMVRPDLTSPRQIDEDDCVVRHVTPPGSTVGEVHKEPRQGEFDNVHLAPKMKLVRVSAMVFQPRPGQSQEISFTVDRDKMRLDDISMAPFCAHDCLHTHWRWGKPGTAKWVLGWDATGPYKVPGAPMVPQNQAVEVWFAARNAMTYHVTVSPPAGASFIQPYTWQVLMYHGSGYAVAMDAWLKKAVDVGFHLLAPPPDFRGEDGSIISPLDSSWSLLYWWCRYGAELTADQKWFTVKERTEMPPDNLKRAMEL
jgi:hypothetical protein